MQKNGEYDLEHAYSKDLGDVEGIWRSLRNISITPCGA